VKRISTILNNDDWNAKLLEIIEHREFITLEFAGATAIEAVRDLKNSEVYLNASDVERHLSLNLILNFPELFT
jgi:hypothetical protein